MAANMNVINNEVFEALASLEKEKGIPMSYLIEKISNAIAIAIKRDFGGSENTIVEIDPAKNRFYVAVRKNVVEEVEDPETEITLADATKYSKVAHIGGVVEIPLENKTVWPHCSTVCKTCYPSGNQRSRKRPDCTEIHG